VKNISKIVDFSAFFTPTRQLAGEKLKKSTCSASWRKG